jgi:hypothetical protein
MLKLKTHSGFHDLFLNYIFSSTQDKINHTVTAMHTERIKQFVSHRGRGDTLCTMHDELEAFRQWLL